MIGASRAAPNDPEMTGPTPQHTNQLTPTQAIASHLRSIGKRSQASAGKRSQATASLLRRLRPPALASHDGKRRRKQEATASGRKPYHSCCHGRHEIKDNYKIGHVR